MGEKTLKTAVLGLSDEGLDLLSAAAAMQSFDICAVADNDLNLTEKIAARYNCTPFDDYRQLVIQNDLDVILVAAPMHLCDEQVRTAMKKNIHIVRLPPPALNFEHTADLVKIARDNGIRMITLSPNRFAPGFCKLREHLRTREISQFHLITATCYLPDNLKVLENRWLSDPKLAGGGVLLRNCYHLIDELVMDIALPEQVYAVSTNHAPDRQQRLSITEDTITVTLKFSETLTGNLIATRIFGPQKQFIRFHSNETVVTASDNSFTITDNTGAVIEEEKFDASRLDGIEKALQNIAEGIINPNANKILGDELADLKNMAVIESAYMSTRTASPEEPARILELESLCDSS